MRQEEDQRQEDSPSLFWTSDSSCDVYVLPDMYCRASFTSMPEPNIMLVNAD